LFFGHKVFIPLLLVYKYPFRDTSIEIEEFQFYQTPLKYGGDCEETIVIDAAVVMLSSEYFEGFL
jgi:hypothetical protein